MFTTTWISNVSGKVDATVHISASNLFIVNSILDHVDNFQLMPILVNEICTTLSAHYNPVAC